MKQSGDRNSQRGARLEDDFVSRSSSDEEMGLRGPDFLSFPHNSLFRRPGPGSRHPHQTNNHNSSSGYSSNNYDSSNISSPRLKGHSGRSKPHAPLASMLPQMSTSPDQKPVYNSRLYEDSMEQKRDALRNSMSRMSRSSLREINNPLETLHLENVSVHNTKIYREVFCGKKIFSNLQLAILLDLNLLRITVS